MVNTRLLVTGNNHVPFVRIGVMELLVFHITAQDHVTYVSSVANTHVITNYWFRGPKMPIYMQLCRNRTFNGLIYLIVRVQTGPQRARHPVPIHLSADVKATFGSVYLYHIVEFAMRILCADAQNRTIIKIWVLGDYSSLLLLLLECR